MNRLSVVAILALLASPVFADEKDKPANGDLAKFQGTWTSSFGANKEASLLVTIKEKAAHVKFTLGDGQSFRGRRRDQARREGEAAQDHRLG